MEPENANVTWRIYYPGGGLRVQTTSTENLSFMVQDHINSTAMILNNSGAVTGEVIYSAWGEVRNSYGSTPTKKLYTGQYEAEAGLYFYNARWYDNQLGRFAQADSIIPEPGNPLAWDRYAGMDNNPIRYNDPSGQSAECGIGDSYCSNLRREYQYSDWQKHLTFNNFILGKEAYIFYYKYEDKAFEDTFLGGEKNSIMWGRIYSEDVLHRLFEPISDFMVLDKIETARDEKDFDLFYTLTSSFALLEWMSADKGFGGGGRIASNSLKGYAAIDAAKELGYRLEFHLK
jgi:RHS repeat-associated protein